MWHHPVRVLWRLLRFIFGVALLGLLDFIFCIWLRGKASSPAARAAWLHRYAKQTLWAVGVEVSFKGVPPSRGFLTANHLSYVDIAVLGAVVPLNFVSKAEVRHWPVIGWLASCGGTLYLRREQKSDVVRVSEQFRSRIESGVIVALFPEGTSTGADRVLSFRPSLLEPAAANQWPSTPAWIGYEMEPGEGTVADDVCYWRDMTFGPHFLNLLSKRKVRALVSFGSTADPKLDRKQLAKVLRSEVCRLATEAGHPVDEALTEQGG